MPLPYPSLLGYTRVVTNNGPVILFLLWKDAKDSVFESSRYYSSVICPKPTVNVDKDKDETELSDQQLATQIANQQLQSEQKKLTTQITTLEDSVAGLQAENETLKSFPSIMGLSLSN